jgi:Zn-dependent M28 family amino/carboxypeptidase
MQPPPKPPPPCFATEPAQVAACVDAERVAQDVEAIARARPPGSVHWRRVQSLCANTFDDLGYAVEMHRYATGINVIGVRDGRSDERVVVGAHYDHIPGCAGADDNASGTAAVLELARVLAGGSFERTLVVACWDEEERGLVGSRAWVDAAVQRGDRLALYLNFDAIAFTSHEPGSQAVPAGFDVLFPEETARLAEQDHRADFIAVITDGRGRPYADAFAEHARAVALPHAVLVIPELLLVAPLAVDLRRSDHASFWDRNVPAMMLTDTANFRSDAYHCKGRHDAVDTLDLPFAVQVVRSAAAAAAFALNETPPRP